jgi:hypothetical protein
MMMMALDWIGRCRGCCCSLLYVHVDENSQSDEQSANEQVKKRKPTLLLGRGDVRLRLRAALVRWRGRGRSGAARWLCGRCLLSGIVLCAQSTPNSVCAREGVSGAANSKTSSSLSLSLTWQSYRGDRSYP